MSITTGYASVNGLRMYYEMQGSGQPLILLHGGVGATQMFNELLKMLADGRQTVAVDLQGHGRTADIDRPLRYELMAEDIAGLIAHLELGTVDVLGYSLGGGVALRFAIQHPALVRKLVLVSTPCKREGWYPEVLAAMSSSGPGSAEAMKTTPMYEMYSRLAPKVEDWPVLHTKLGEMLRRDYDWSAAVANMKVPTMLALGDADSVSTAHAVEFFGLLGGGKKDAGWDRSGMSKSRLAILPGVTHYDIFTSPTLASIVRRFLDAP